MLDYFNKMWDKIKKSVIYKRKSAYQACFCDAAGNLTYNGEIIINDLQKVCNVYTSTAISRDGRIDPLELAFNEGQRTVYNRIIHILQIRDADLVNTAKRNIISHDD